MASLSKMFSGIDDEDMPWNAYERLTKRVSALEAALRRAGERLRYLASSVDPKELEHELHALARECENLVN